MTSIPVGRRTRLQRAMMEELNKEKNKGCLPTRSTRSSVRKYANVGLVIEEKEKEEEDDEDDIMVVDEAEYNRRVAALKTNSIKQNGNVERNQDSVKDDTSKSGKDDDNNEEDKDNSKGHMTYEVSDDSLEIIEEKPNSDYSCESSAVTSSDSDDETVNVHREAEDEVGSSTEKEINENDNVDGGDSDSDRLKCSDRNDEKRREGVSTGVLFGKRKYDGLVLPATPLNNAPKDDFVGRRTRSHRRIKFPRMKTRDGTVSCPVTIDDDSHSSSDSDKDDSHENRHRPNYANACGIVGSRKRRRPRRGAYVECSSESESDSDSESDPLLDPESDSDPENDADPENDPMLENDPKVEAVHEPLNDKGCENVGFRKRGRLRRSTCGEGNSQPKNNFVQNGPILETDSKVEHVPKPVDDKGCENAGFSKRDRPRRSTCVEGNSQQKNNFVQNGPILETDSKVEHVPKPVDDKGCENAGFSKRDRPRRSTCVEGNSQPKNNFVQNGPILETDSKVQHVPKPVDDKGCENAGFSKRDRPLRSTCVEGNSQPKNNFVQNGPILETDSKVQHVPKPVDDKGCENAGFSKRDRPLRSTCVEGNSQPKNNFVQNGPILKNESKAEHVPKPVEDKGRENVVKRKRGRPPKNRNVEKECSPPWKKQKLKSSKVENILLNAILENSNTGWENPACSVTGAFLPLKFSFTAKKSLPEKTEEEEEIEGLFNDLDFALRTCDVGCSTSCSEEDGEDDDVDSDDGAVVQGKLCCRGKHYFILDDQIGIRCKYCSFVKLEIRYVTPAFDTDPFGRSENKNYRLFPCDGYKAAVLNGLNLPDFEYSPEHVHSDNDQGTVWDLVPGVKKSLYPHQQEAFEFIWRNVGGTTKIDELGKPTNPQIGGCIICHAPGTGKTRLAITFLQSFIKKNPMSRPVIVSPTSMLLTWEEEFARWNVDVPFHNLNKTEPSGKEDPEAVRATNNVRLQKLCSWAKGKGILGISYRLFDELAGERKGMDERIKKALLEQPGILVLDEGHTPRNNDSNIWNVLTKVKTKRRIILSGTPFQNNFDELHNTFSLVREEFRNPLLLGNYINEDRKIAALRKWIKPFVHVHKGEILKKTLRGLFHSVVFLKPSDLQKTCCQQLFDNVRYIIEENHLVSVACVHPSLLTVCNHVPDVIDKGLLEKHKENMEVGLKIKFILELINLAVGEKILIFSQYLQPLNFIADLLKSRYNWTDGKGYLYMKGQQATKQRQAYINLFNDPSSEVRVLLASIKACGEGIHLVGASRVVLLDVVWNPSVERQAISRAYRIGQLKDVFVYHLILSETLEEKKYHTLVNKGRLSELVFSESDKSEKINNLGSKISKDRVLEEMIQNEKTNNMFVKIVRESRADELIKSFIPENQ